MNKTLKVALIVFAALALIGGALAGGWFLGGQRVQTVTTGITTQTGDGTIDTNNYPYNRPGMMGSRDTRGPGGMMGSGYGGMTPGPGMMQGYGSSVVTTPLTVDQAAQAAQKYLDTLNLPDLKIAEVMIFDNGAYVRVVEQSTGLGAFELLVDPATQAVYPEHGPNIMWNLKYGGLTHSGMMGGGGYGMMNSNQWDGTVPEVSAAMVVSADQARQNAQTYLDSALPGATVAEDADAFYGYYTIDVMKDGKVYGMLSVNGSTGQVIYHSWHGTFIEMSESK
jgi:hypothetical protein